MARLFLLIAAIFGGLSVATGAFATHALKASLSARSLLLFEVGTRYQMYHALALLAVGLVAMQIKITPLTLRASGWLFMIGTIIFSGSLYALAMTNIPLIGVITPSGGVALILGWIMFAIAVFNLKLNHQVNDN